ncbi:MAG: hypothetical protein WBY44_09075 [Bryobacteraceae bacterium]|jgi:uncharacterized protein (UPF0332 family)
MALADDLLEQAAHLATREPKRPKQASLRRAVSTAYYSLFHLLISSGISHWKDHRQRPIIARSFSHTVMREASQKIANKQFPASDAAVATSLKMIANAFIDLQQERHNADYSYVKKWSRTEVQSHIDSTAKAFAAGKRIRDERLAKDYLISMLFRER